MSDLRNHLFETLEALKDEEKPMDLARAKAISDVAQTIIGTAKVEIEMIKAINADSGSDFFDGHRIESTRPLRELPRARTAS